MCSTYFTPQCVPFVILIPSENSPGPFVCGCSNEIFPVSYDLSPVKLGSPGSWVEDAEQPATEFSVSQGGGKNAVATLPLSLLFSEIYRKISMVGPATRSGKKSSLALSSALSFIKPAVSTDQALNISFNYWHICLTVATCGLLLFVPFHVWILGKLFSYPR